MKTEDTTSNALSSRKFCEWIGISYLGSHVRTQNKWRKTPVIIRLTDSQEPTTDVLKMSDQIKGLCCLKI